MRSSPPWWGNLTDDNPTSQAIREKFPGSAPWQASELVPFSSARKWSGAFFPGQGACVMGAGEFILGESFERIRPQVESYSSGGQRVLLLGEDPGALRGQGHRRGSGVPGPGAAKRQDPPGGPPGPCGTSPTRGWI